MNPPATSASATLPFKPPEETALPSGSQWGVAVVLCLVALALVLWTLRKRGAVALGWPRGGVALLDILETRPLTPQVRLVVARYAGRRLLLSVGPAGTQCLRDDADADVDGDAKVPQA